MNLERDLVFCFIEEDNIQRAYFRVRPLLTVHGDVQQDAANLWPDNGCLRIVPDRNEQHTFKERMRTLGGYCMMNLQGIPSDANKIRTNKNYKPERGENNQFILYSDTVQPLPEHTFFQVIESTPDDFAKAAKTAVTPLFYIRENDTLFGPVRKAAPEKPDTAKEAQGTLFPVACPDGQERVLLCIEEPMPAEKAVPAVPQEEPKADEPAAEPAAPANENQEGELPIGKPLQILDQNKNFEETLQGLDQPLSKDANLLRHAESKIPEQPVVPGNDKPLSGTPLYRANMRTAVPQPKNKLQEVVSAQWRVARNEPPTAPLPAGAKMHQVENPVEIACTSMKAAWQVPEAQTQLIDLILSLDGMRAKLEPYMVESTANSPLQKAMQAHLQDMEAERLSVLLQLDKAKADLDAFRRTTLDSLSEKTKQETTKLEAAKAELESAVSDLKAQQDALLAQRDELLRRIDELQQSSLPAALAKAMADAQLAAPVAGIPLRMSPVSGHKVEVDEMIQRVMDAFNASGLPVKRNHAIAMLAVLAASSRIGLVSAAPAAASTLVKNLATALGWQNGFVQQVTTEQKPLLSPLPADAAPAVLLTTLAAYAPLDNITKVILARNTGNLTRNAAYETCSWPIVQLPGLPVIPEVPAHDGCKAISTVALKALLDQPAIAQQEIEQILSGILAQITPISGASLKEMQQFISACAALMDGGLAAACDWAILLWILPGIDRNAKTANALKPLLAEYPLSLAKLQA